MTTFLALTLTAAAAPTTTAAPSWSQDVLADFRAADPDGGWDMAPATAPTAADRAKADILIEAFSDGSVSATHHGDVTLKRGQMAAISPDGTQALLVADDVLVCDALGACTALPGVEPDEIDFQNSATSSA